MTDLLHARLSLRHWREEDLEPFAALNADPLRHALPVPALTREESDALARAGADPDLGAWLGAVGA